MGTELDALLAHLVQLVQAHDLEASGIGEDRPIPAHEPVEPAKGTHGFDTGAQVEVVGVSEQDIAARRPEFVGRERLDRSHGTDGHEGRRRDFTVCGREPSGTCRGSRVLGFECVVEGHSWAVGRSGRTV